MKFEIVNEKDIISLPDWGLGCFMVVHEVEFEVFQQWITIKGEMFEINQGTGKPESKGKHVIDAGIDINIIYEDEEVE